MELELSSIFQKLKDIQPIRVYGKVTKVVGLTVESEGPPASIGEIVLMEDNDIKTPFQVIGFNHKKVISMPLGDVIGIYPGQRLYSTESYPGLKIDESFLGRVINGRGVSIDGKGELRGRDYIKVYNKPINPMKRKPISKILSTGIRAVDGFITVGQGQRIGVFSGSGVGKSTTMGMIARNTNADINVICLVGERGRELKDFLDNSLGEEGLKRSVVIVATSDEPPLIKILSAFTAAAVSEYFSGLGYNVMLMMDSLTRLSMAQREVGLSAGEPPSTKGYTPSVFTQMPMLMERAGNFEKGSITAIYTVLVEGDDINEPVSDHARSILDGHIVLSREIAHKNHYPAIDVLGSISRLMDDIASDVHKKAAGRLKELIAVYKEAEDLINIGAYAEGSNKKIDIAINKIDIINDFLKQGKYEKSTFEQTVSKMVEILKDEEI